MKHLILCMGIVCCINFFTAQTTRELKEIVIQIKQDTFSSNTLNQQFSKKEIQAIPFEDVGVITQKITGISLKNYGGLGGLKTISFRGISGNHSVVLLNEFALNNHQIGQIDLGAIQVENVEQIRFTSVSKPEYLYPVSSLVSANTLAIQTFENTFTGKNNQIRFNTKMGSFNQIDNYLSLKKIIGGKLFSIYGKHRSFKGRYPFQYINGVNEINGIRNNNDLAEWNAGIHFSKIKENVRWNAAYHFYQSDKGLPGAVIFYNDLASQRLFTQNHLLNLERIVCQKKFNSKVYSSFQFNQMTYTDPSYLNSLGSLIQTYYNNTFVIGDIFTKTSKDSIYDFYGGLEYQLNSLETENTTTSYNPERQLSMIVLGVNVIKKLFSYQFQLNNHQVITLSGHSNSYKSFFTGSIFTEKNIPIRILGKPRFQFKRTMRLPSFGELYINTIYEKEIKPEIVNQVDFGSSLFLFKCKIGVDLYVNLIENKIVAIPTKNLFLWSVQNVGKVFTKGVDISLERSFFSESAISLKTKSNYSFQSSLDYSSQNSPSYKHQIAYIPKHTLAFDVNVDLYKRFAFNWSTTILSNRYALNENINSNIVEGFTTSDISLSITQKIKQYGELKCNLSLKNLFNTSYQYIRYYVMPGRNYLISLSYAF